MKTTSDGLPGSLSTQKNKTQTCVFFLELQGRRTKSALESRLHYCLIIKALFFPFTAFLRSPRKIAGRQRHSLHFRCELWLVGLGILTYFSTGGTSHIGSDLLYSVASFGSRSAGLQRHHHQRIWAVLPVFLICTGDRYGKMWRRFFKVAKGPEV